MVGALGPLLQVMPIRDTRPAEHEAHGDVKSVSGVEIDGPTLGPVCYYYAAAHTSRVKTGICQWVCLCCGGKCLAMLGN